jgi:hypothetical protein
VAGSVFRPELTTPISNRENGLLHHSSKAGSLDRSNPGPLDAATLAISLKKVTAAAIPVRSEDRMVIFGTFSCRHETLKFLTHISLSNEIWSSPAFAGEADEMHPSGVMPLGISLHVVRAGCTERLFLLRLLFRG